MVILFIVLFVCLSAEHRDQGVALLIKALWPHWCRRHGLSDRVQRDGVLLHLNVPATGGILASSWGNTQTRQETVTHVTQRGLKIKRAETSIASSVGHVLRATLCLGAPIFKTLGLLCSPRAADMAKGRSRSVFSFWTRQRSQTFYDCEGKEKRKKLRYCTE